MVGLAILLILVLVLYEDIVQDKEPNVLRFVVPVLAGLITWNPLIGALVLVGFFTLFDPIYKLMDGKPFFHSNRMGFRDFLAGRCGLYDIVNGRVALMVEIFSLTVILIELLI